MGLSLKKLGKSLVDVFSADTQSDQQKRLAAGQQRFYADQQRAMGNQRPATNPVSAFFGNTARQANTSKAAVGGLYGLGKIGISSLFGTDQGYQNTLRGVNQTLNRDFSPTGGVFGAGTAFDSANQAANLGMGDFAKKTLAAGTGVAGETLPVGRGVSVAKQGLRVVPRLAAEGAAIGALGSAGDQYIRTGRVDPKSVALSAAAGGVLAAAPPVVLAGGKKALQVADNRVPLNQAGSVTVPTKPKVTAKVVEPKKVGLATEVKRGLTDKDQVILAELRNIEKQTGETGLVDKFMYNSNMQRGSNAVANQVLSTSENVRKAIGGLSKDEYKNFSDYANARTELSSAVKGTPLSRSRGELEATVRGGDAQYGARFQAENQHFKELAEVWHDSGIIDDKTFKSYVDNDNYIRLQRDMGDKLPDSFGKGSSYQLGSTTAKQRRKGSTRGTLDTGGVMAERTQQVYREAAKNKTGTFLADTLQQNGLAKKLSIKEAQNRNTMSIFRNGKKEFYEVSPAIKEAIDNINPYQMNAVMKILAAPGRVMRAGITGLNPVFIARNLLKDQVGSAIHSQHLFATHTPRSFFEGLFNATSDAAGVSKNPLYQDFLKHYGDQTSFDLTRNLKDTKQVINRIRGGRVVGIGQAIKAPIRSLENVASITEKSTRFQNFAGEYRKALKQGLPKEVASEKAAIAAWQNSVDFSRAGTWGRVINTVIPYWNPATQGVRQLVRTGAKQPIKSGFVATALVGVPIASATAWNISNPEVKAVYDQIPEHEKENNIVVVNPDGKGGYFKAPLPPGFKDLFMPVRRALEAFSGDKPIDAAKIAQDILQSVSGPVGVQTKGQFAGSFLPQAVKPVIQQYANQDLFTGKQIVPDFVNQATDAEGNPIPEPKKAFSYTSGAARGIGDITGLSPIRVEKAVKDVAGTVGLNVLNAADQLLAKTGKIPKEQVGGQSVGEGFKRSFTGNTQEFAKSEGSKYFERQKAFSDTLTSQEKGIFNKINPSKKNFLGEDIYDSSKLTKASDYGDMVANPEFTKKYQAFQKSQPNHDPLWDLDSNQLRSYMQAQIIGKNDPGGDSNTTRQLYDRLPPDFFSKREQFFADLKTSGVDLKASDYTPRPKMPDNLQAFSDSYHLLPYGTGARSSALRSPEGVAYIAWLDQNRIYNNQERADLGLPPLEDSSSKYGSSGGAGKAKTGGSVYKYAISPGSGGSAPRPKVSVKKTGGGKKVARKGGGKPRVSIKKSLV